MTTINLFIRSIICSFVTFEWPGCRIKLIKEILQVRFLAALLAFLSLVESSCYRFGRPNEIFLSYSSLVLLLLLLHCSLSAFRCSLRFPNFFLSCDFYSFSTFLTGFLQQNRTLLPRYLYQVFTLVSFYFFTSKRMKFGRLGSLAFRALPCFRHIFVCK